MNLNFITQIKSLLFDSNNNALTTTPVSSKRGLDNNIINPSTSPIYVQGTDGNAAYQLPLRTQFPNTIGQNNINNSLGVVIASDQPPINVVAIPVDGWKATYSCSIVGLIPPSTPTDIFTISGSATKIIKITKIIITATQTTSTIRDILILKRSTLNSGGTFSSPIIVSHDSTNITLLAIIKAYTVNPTSLGTLVGNMVTMKILIGNTTTNPDELILDWGTRPSQAIVLRGVNEMLAINLNSITSAGNNFDISIEFTEE
jgi:hypothetical protein